MLGPAIRIPVRFKGNHYDLALEFSEAKIHIAGESFIAGAKLILSNELLGLIEVGSKLEMKDLRYFGQCEVLEITTNFTQSPKQDKSAAMGHSAE